MIKIYYREDGTAVIKGDDRLKKNYRKVLTKHKLIFQTFVLTLKT